MANTKKDKAEAARSERSKAQEKNTSKAQADLIKEYRAKMQAGINGITKKLECKAMGFEPPQGTNGAVSTGTLCLDLITGGGFPKHRMSTVAGDSGTGKTTLVGKSEGWALAQGLLCHHQDLEGAADYTWMLKNGTDMNLYLGSRGKPKSLYYIPDFPSGDASFRYMARVMDEAIKHGAENLPFLSNVFYHDSLPACIPEIMLANDEKGSSPDLAILMSRELPRVRIKLRKANAAYIAINQIRENPRAQFSKPLYEPCGNAPTFYADMKLWFVRTGKAKTLDFKHDHPITPKDTSLFKAEGISIEQNPNGTEDRYFYTRAKSVKNRVFPPLKETYFRMWTEENGGTGRGIDPVWDVIHFFEEVGLCQFHSMKEVILKGQVYSYWDLKQEILAKPDLGLEARSLLDSGKAFELYFNRLMGGGAAIGTADPEEGNEAEGEVK